MPGEVERVEAPESFFRIGRKPNPWEWPDWAFAGPDGTFGNRWDDPRKTYRVLYAATEKLGAFLEILARFRPDPAVIVGLAEIDGEDDCFPIGRVPASLIQNRLISSATPNGTFADVRCAASLAYLRTAMAERLVHYGLSDLDGATIRLSVPRTFTQEVSRHIFELTEPESSQRRFAGICYSSRLGDEYVNWAVFEDSDGNPGVIIPISFEPITEDDPDLCRALEILDLEIS